MAAPRDRLTLAVAAGALSLPPAGRIAVIGPQAGADLSALPEARLHVVTTLWPDHDHFARLGYDTGAGIAGRYAAAIVHLPRARALAQARLAAVAAVCDGPVFVDGDKTSGVEAMLRACRRRGRVSEPFSKAHGKLFRIDPPFGFRDWAAPSRQVIADGFVTAPGVFSADAIDPASRLLADHLPPAPGCHVVDLGGGWGYLSARLLERDSVVRLDLVEADLAALDCARVNLTDPRARLHWADATSWRPEEGADAVVTNPPFHTGRDADPELGRAFIAAAAGMLKSSGSLWLVANRHLPYEATLHAHFKSVCEVGGDARFKVLSARGLVAFGARKRR